MSDKSFLIPADELRKTFTNVLLDLKADPWVVNHVVQGLVQTSLRGVDSHGIRLFPHYVRALKAGRINGQPNFEFDQTASSVAKLDADHTYGHASGAKAMEKAIEIAKQTGAGAVAVYNSSHFGAAAYCGLMAAQKNMIGISLTHADSLMLSTNGIRPFFGTNPICVTAPVDGEEPFCLDMATTTITWNKVKMHREKNQPLEPGLAADEHGHMTTDPHAATCLFPAGDYKGFGLSMVVDILCALLSGMPLGREITSMYLTPITEKRFLGQFYMALDVDKFVGTMDFKKRLKFYMDQIRQEPVHDPRYPVMVPGDPEKKAWIARSKYGIPLSEYEIKAFREILDECGHKLSGVNS